MKAQEAKKIILESLEKLPIVQSACQKAGISRMTYYRWLKKSQTFKKQVEEIMNSGFGRINDLAESKLIGQINDGHLRAITFWLTNHHPTYSNKAERFGRELYERLSKEQIALIEKALNLNKYERRNQKSSRRVQSKPNIQKVLGL